MTTTNATRMTADQFWEWCARPEQENKSFELDEGEVIEVPPPGERHGTLCLWIGHLLLNYVLGRGQGGVTSNDTALIIEENPGVVRGPDLMVFADSRSYNRLSPGPVRRIPQLVVEVASPSDSWSSLIRRVEQYLTRGVPLVWVVDPEAQTVSVFRRDEHPRILSDQDELTGNGELPGLSLRISTIFQTPGTPDEMPES